MMMTAKRIVCMALCLCLLLGFTPALHAHAAEEDLPALTGKTAVPEGTELPALEYQEAGGSAPVLNTALSDYANTNEEEPNNSMDTAMVVYNGTDVLAATDSADEVDLYRINLGEATALGIYSIADQPVMLFGIVDSEGYVIDVSNYYGTAESLYVDGMEIILPAGTYYVLVMQTTYSGVEAYANTMNYVMEFRGHTPSGTITEVQAATCTEMGIVQFSCSTCGNTVNSHVPALGHSYSGSTCSRCGEADPEYTGVFSDEVSRIAGENRIETSLSIANALKQEMGVSQFGSIIVASALNFPDALTGSYLAAVKSAPILLTYDAVHSQILSYISANLAPGGTVYILGGQSAVSSSFENQLRAAGIYYKRLAGNDRFGTNLAILNEAGVTSGTNLLVCTAYGFADSLSASATGLPILLVGKSLTNEQKAFLNRANANVTIIGGTSAVSSGVEAALRSQCGNNKVNRLQGADRFQTSVIVALRFFPAASSAVAAYAWNYPDGLCGGPLAYTMGAPLLLTDSVDSTASSSYTLTRLIQSGYVLGGNTLISDDAARRLFNLRG